MSSSCATRSNAARKALFACCSVSAYSLILNSVPMCGSTASKRCGSTACAQRGAKASSQTLLFVVLHPTVPITIHLFGRGYTSRADQPEAKPLGIRHVPDAFRQLGVLFLPTCVGSNP